jgi:hypothetical protein
MPNCDADIVATHDAIPCPNCGKPRDFKAIRHYVATNRESILPALLREIRRLHA